MEQQTQQPSLSPNNGFYTPEQPTFENQENEAPMAATNISVEWEASEYVHHSKGAGWFILVALATLSGLAVALYFQQWLFAVLVVAMGIAFGIFGRRQPRVLHYGLSNSGLTISAKQYSFADFRAFGVRTEGAFYTVMLVPVKRLAPGLNIYFSETEADQVLGILGSHLPMEQMEADPIDFIMSKLRF
ncbi:MAG TPA: hypothetical protein VFT87_01690 [Candidatus Saccharimonadales bacterium]|nr:hypothetical protein [Candidatus Saccharimonadales bacterium]